ncbi:MAG: hypothetical protein FWF77_08950 [Defluviitaleaceae bacterium]|nr:hypothetical protein [Defluviitaleaceae bacterium]
MCKFIHAKESKKSEKIEKARHKTAPKKSSRRVTLADSIFSANRKLLPALRECVAARSLREVVAHKPSGSA